MNLLSEEHRNTEKNKLLLDLSINNGIISIIKMIIPINKI